MAPVALYFKAQQQKHEREHLERMKALEMGRPFDTQPMDRTRCAASRVALLIGGGVPAVVFGCTAFASMAAGYHEAMWIAAALVGLGGVICGTVLAATMLTVKTTTTTDESSGAFTGGKPPVEDDAYDVVSARG